MVILGNLPSQLCVLDSSQQLYAPLFLASSPSLANTLFSKLSEKPPSEKLLRPSTSLSHFSPSSDLLYDLCRSHLFCPPTMLSPPTIPPKQTPLLLYNVVTSNDLCSSHLSCTTPPATIFSCTTPSVVTFPSFSSAPLNGLRDPLFESSSTRQSPIAASKSEVDSLWPLRM